MNKLKTLTCYTLYILLVAFAVGCRERASVNRDEDYKKNDVLGVYNHSRINMVETTILNGHRYSIIKIDEKEFFVNADGGVYPLSN